jgi:16S rRNA (guanine527-N7)-methyltransferase
VSDLLTEVLTESRDLGFLGPGPIQPHLDHAAAFAAAVDHAPARALDLGAGGGLPGLALAATVWPETRWTFADAAARRTAFLEWGVETLGLGDRVTVVTGRSEEIARDPEHRGSYDLVTARSFGAPPVTAECAAGFLTLGGHLVVSEPPVSVTEERWPRGGVGQFGFGPARPVLVDGDPPAHLVVLVAEKPVADRYPRRVGIPAKRPMF